MKLAHLALTPNNKRRHSWEFADSPQKEQIIVGRFSCDPSVVSLIDRPIVPYYWHLLELTSPAGQKDVPP